MRWERAALAAALVLGACTQLVPSASPSQSAAPIARRSVPPATGTLAPTPTPRPRASAAPSASPAPLTAPLPRGPLVEPTPRPTVAPTILNAACSEWPADVVPVVTQLALPPSLCLLRVDASATGGLACTVVGCVPVSAECASFGSCIQEMDGTLPHYVLLWLRAPESPPPPLAEPYGMTRYLCRLHQERTLIDLGRPANASWAATLEGREFSTAFARFRSAYAPDAARWRPDASDVENYADVCAAWYVPAGRDQRVAAYLPLYDFAQKWLPR